MKYFRNKKIILDPFINKNPQKNLLVRTAGFKLNVMQTKY